MTPREWNTGVATGALRVGAGLGLLRWRRPLATRLAGAADDDHAMTALLGFFGTRDLAVGLATLAATRPSGDVPKMLRLQALADAIDAGLILAAHRAGRLSRARAIGGAAVAIVSSAGFLASSVAVARDPSPS